MIILLILKSIAFAALFEAPIGWELKLFLASALLLIDFHLTLLDIQEDENFETQQKSLFAVVKAIEQRIENSNSKSVQEAIDELFTGMRIRNSVGPRELYFVGIPILFSLASVVAGWLISKYLLG